MHFPWGSSYIGAHAVETEAFMSDWTHDPPVLIAIHEFELAHAKWLLVAPADGILGTGASAAQQAAFDRRRRADRAYVLARDCAIDRVTQEFEIHDDADQSGMSTSGGGAASSANATSVPTLRSC